jgi:spore germination protein YaaH
MPHAPRLRTVFLFPALLVIPLAASAQIGGAAAQNVRLTVQPILRLQVSGNPDPLVVTQAVAGSELTSVQDTKTRYSLVTNLDNVKIVASINQGMPAGTTLTLALGSTRGTGRGAVNISNATSPLEVVTNIRRGADKDQTITYTFGALSSAGQISSVSRIVTLTLTN